MYSNKKEIWAFGGGKGGVGKSIICINIALALSLNRKKVLLIDADFGAANIHTYLGADSPQKTISDYIAKDTVNLEDIIFSSPYNNLYFIGGGEDALQVSNLDKHHISSLIHDIKSLNFDYILIDLGAGTMTHTIDIFNSSQKGILVTTPEPASIENTYRFMKYSFFRKLITYTENKDVKSFLQYLTSEKQDHLSSSLINIFNKISEIDEVSSKKLKKEMFSFNQKLILNQVRNNNDVRIGFSMSKCSLKYLGIRLEYSGFIENDDQILKTTRNKIPILVSEPFSRTSRGIKKITENLNNNEQMFVAII